MPAEQQAVGLAYTAALVDLAVADDTRSLPLLDGTRVKPRSIGRASAFVHAIGGNKRLLYAAGRGAAGAARTATHGARVPRLLRGRPLRHPHRLRAGAVLRADPALVADGLRGNGARAARARRWTWTAGRREPPSFRSAPASGHGDALDFRIAGEPGAAPVEIDVRVRDASGAWVALGQRPMTLRSYHGLAPLGKVVARQLRVAPPVRGRGLRDVTGVELIPRTPRGRFWLLDVSTREQRLAAATPIDLPRVSVSDARRSRRRAAARTPIELPIVIDGEVTRRARLWVQLTDLRGLRRADARLPARARAAGATRATMPFTYTRRRRVRPVRAASPGHACSREKNAVTADFAGTVAGRGGRPAPALTVDAAT